MNATALNISWEAPISPNGVIESYTLKLPTPRIEIRDPQQTYHVVYNLIPYTQYFVSVIACTGMWSPWQFADGLQCFKAPLMLNTWWVTWNICEAFTNVL